MVRVKTAFVSGTITNNPLLIGGVTLTSAELSTFPTIASPDIGVIILDPRGTAGAPEVVWVTAHTAAATTATITRGQEGTAARQHLLAVPWVHGPTINDFSPPEATYLVGAAHAQLSAPIVVGATPGGELGGTWASPTIDAVHSGSAHFVSGNASSLGNAASFTVLNTYVDIANITIPSVGTYLILATVQFAIGGAGDIMELSIRNGAGTVLNTIVTTIQNQIVSSIAWSVTAASGVVYYLSGKNQTAGRGSATNANFIAAKIG